MHKSARIAYLLVLIFLCREALSAPVRLSGKAPDYANNSVRLFRFHDFISEEPVTLSNIQFAADGSFNAEFELTETSFCFASFDGYRAMIYLEPGKNYQVLFPPKRTLTESQKRNPFVKPDPVWLAIVDPKKNELNYQIQQFEQAYAKYENRYFDQIFLNRNKALVDTVKNQLSKEFKETGSTFFESHKTYRKGNLDFALNQGKSAAFMEQYFGKKKPHYQLAAYSNLFNQTFLNYFSLLVTHPTHSKIRKMIETNSLQQLDDYFQKQLQFNPELSHLVLLKSINDAYYSKQFGKAVLLKMLDQTAELGWSSYEQKIARLIRSKLTYLTSGTLPPVINLKNLSGQKIGFGDFRNTYIYLHFTDPQNTICRQHLDKLKEIAPKFGDKLTIINVIPGNRKFLNDQNWIGIFATSETSIEETFKVKTFPTSFLIGKDDKLLLSPAPNPIDGLDRQLGQIFKSDYFKEMQKTNNPGAK